MISSGALLVLSLMLIGVGLSWDRPGFRGRPGRWCRGCTYDLSGAGEVPVRCTECGREHATERSMRRVRRHKRIVVLGVLLLMGSGVLGLVPAGLRGELMKPLPSWLLVEMQPLFPEQPWSIKNHPSRELTKRLMDTTDPMPHAEIAKIINHVASGSLIADAGSKRWVNTSGRWIGGQVFRFGSKEAGWNYPDRTPADQQLSEAFDRLMNVLPEWDPVTRDRWPQGHPVTIASGFRHPHWPVHGDLNERAVLRLKGFEPIEREFLGALRIDPLGEAGDVIEGEIELRYYRVGSWDRTESDGPIKTQAFAIRWRVVESFEQAIDPIEDSFILETVARELVILAKDGDFTQSILQNSVWEARAFEQVAMGLRIKLLDGEEPIVEHRIHWMCRDGDVRTVSQGRDEFVSFHAVDDRIHQAALAGTLRVQIVGDPEEGMKILDAKRCWVGEIDLLYTDAVAAESKRVGTEEAGEGVRP